MKVGFIVNPIAGLGGAVGLKGTDGDSADLAHAKGAVPRANARARRAIDVLASSELDVTFICAAGDMGESIISESRFSLNVVGQCNKRTSRADTVTACQIMLSSGVDLIIFAGGDGTARDIESVVGMQLPVVAIPCGVKMHSAIFANSPAQAGQLALLYLRRKSDGLINLEVMDINEEKYRSGIVSPALFGYMSTPNIRTLVQGPKESSIRSDDDVAGIAQSVIEDMHPDTFYVIGPGTTAKSIMRQLGLDFTLIGVDIIRNNQLVVLDADETKILNTIEYSSCKLIVSVIGGQGFLFGRGNQQVSSRVVQSAGIDNIIAVATQRKLAQLGGKYLQIDLNDVRVESAIPKYLKVTSGYRSFTICPTARVSSHPLFLQQNLESL